MAVVRIGSKNQVVIPKEVREELGVRPGDYVEVSIRRIDDFPETDEPIGPQTRRVIARGKREVRQGRVTARVSTREELRDHLNRLKKR